MVKRKVYQLLIFLGVVLKTQFKQITINLANRIILISVIISKVALSTVKISAIRMLLKLYQILEVDLVP